MPLAAGEVGHGGDVFYRVSCMVEGSSTRGGTVFERATKKIVCGQLVLAVDVCDVRATNAGCAVVCDLRQLRHSSTAQ